MQLHSTNQFICIGSILENNYNLWNFIKRTDIGQSMFNSCGTNVELIFRCELKLFVYLSWLREHMKSEIQVFVQLIFLHWKALSIFWTEFDKIGNGYGPQSSS